jgi:hypothetical protein
MPTRNEDQIRIEPEVDDAKEEIRRELIRRWQERTHERRTMWRKRRGWDTP